MKTVTIFHIKLLANSTDKSKYYLAADYEFIRDEIEKFIKSLKKN